MLSEKERACLAYLTDKMEASGRMIGEALVPVCGGGRSPRGYAIVGNNVARRLMFERGFTTYLPDLKAWRITRAGRYALAAK